MSVSTAELKEKTRRFWEETFPSNDDAGVAEFIHPNTFDHMAPPGSPQGVEDVKRTMHWLNGVFTNLRWEIHQMIGESDTIAVYCTFHGEQTGELMGIPATGRQIAQPYVHILRFEDGKAIERWGIRDDLSLMHQLGVIPEQPPNGDKAS